jgi:hypothetical protein
MGLATIVVPYVEKCLLTGVLGATLHTTGRCFLYPTLLEMKSEIGGEESNER